MTTVSDETAGCEFTGRHATTIVLSSGLVFCPVCRAEWDPDNPPTPVTRPTVAEVDGKLVTELESLVAELDDEADALLAEMVGTEVVTLDGRHAIIRGFPDDDHVTLEYPNGRKATVDAEEVAGTADALATAESPPAELDDEQAVTIGRASLSVAGMVLQAGLASLADDDGGYRMLMPPSGWIVPEVDALPVVEIGAAYAIATLIAAFELPRAQVEAFAKNLLTDAQEPIERNE